MSFDAGRRRAWRSAGLSLVVTTCVAMPVLGQVPDVTTDLGLRFSVGHSDNILRAAADEQSGTYRALGFYFDTVRQGPRLNADLAGDVEVRDYSRPTIDNEPIGSINGSLAIDAVPDIFTWVFDENYGQGQVDPFRAAGPNNRQEINIFSTGPRVNLPLSERMFLRMSATASRRRFDNTGNLDSDSVNREVGLFRALSTTTEVGLSWMRRDISYDDSVLSWEVDTILLNYRRQLASGAATLGVGESTIDFGPIESSNPILNLSWTRQVGARSQFALTASRTQADPGDGFARANVVGNLGAIGGVNAFLGAGVYELTDLSLANTTTYARSTVSFGIAVAESDYLNNPDLNNDQRRLFFSTDRDISTRLSVGLTAALLERDYVRLDRDDLDRNLQLWLQRELGRRFSMQLTYLRNSRGGQTNFPYSENSFVATLRLDLNP